MSTDKKQALYEHVMALRRVFLVSLAAVGILFVLFFYLFCDQLVDFVLYPVRSRGISVISTAVSEALMTQLKVCLIAAVVAGMPVIIQQIWSFVSPALYPHEKKLFAGLFFAALLLFLTGVVFCYLYVFPLAINLFWAAADTVATAMWSVKEYFNFVLSFVLPFGLMFELPVVIFMLAKRGKVNYAKLAGWRKYVVLIIAVAAAILTPPDVVSQCMLALPMYLLYEVATQLARFVKPSQPEEEEA
ncbi:MAG: twin-arginine translocase subunit TatC [bacterium]|nr:twin-arginine translocase subunit TatC [bacterium]